MTMNTPAIASWLRMNAAGVPVEARCTLRLATTCSTAIWLLMLVTNVCLHLPGSCGLSRKVGFPYHTDARVQNAYRMSVIRYVTAIGTAHSITRPMIIG